MAARPDGCWPRMEDGAAVLDGASRADAARLAGMGRQSPRDWAHRFNAAGIDGLYDRPHTGRPSRLRDGQQAASRRSCCAARTSRRMASVRGPRRISAGSSKNATR